MAVATVGGLLDGTVIALLIVSVMYEIIIKRRKEDSSEETLPRTSKN